MRSQKLKCEAGYHDFQNPDYLNVNNWFKCSHCGLAVSFLHSGKLMCYPDTTKADGWIYITLPEPVKTELNKKINGRR